MTLCDIISPKFIKLDLESVDKDEVFEELVEVIVCQNPNLNRTEILDALITRENQMSTAVMQGIAVPHARCSCVKNMMAVLGLSKSGVDYDDGNRVHVVLMILMGNDGTEKHLQILQDAAFVLEHEDFVEDVLSQKSPEDVFKLLSAFEFSHVGA